MLIFGVSYLIAQGLADTAPGALTRRTALASLRMAVDPVDSGLITPEEALGRLSGIDVDAIAIRRVFLEVEENNQPAVRLYQRTGFQTVGRREQYYRDASGGKLNALIMQRDLS